MYLRVFPLTVTYMSTPTQLKQETHGETTDSVIKKKKTHMEQCEHMAKPTTLIFLDSFIYRTFTKILKS